MVQTLFVLCRIHWDYTTSEMLLFLLGSPSDHRLNLDIMYMYIAFSDDHWCVWNLTECNTWMLSSILVLCRPSSRCTSLSLAWMSSATRSAWSAVLPPALRTFSTNRTREQFKDRRSLPKDWRLESEACSDMPLVSEPSNMGWIKYFHWCDNGKTQLVFF